MSEILYMKISTQNIACSQRQINMCIHHSVIHRERERRGGGGGGRETDRQTDRQTDRETETATSHSKKEKKTSFHKNRSLG